MRLTEAKLKSLILEALEDDPEEEEEQFEIKQKEIDNLIDLASSDSSEEISQALFLYESLAEVMTQEQKDQVKYPIANAFYKNKQLKDALKVLFPEGYKNGEFDIDEFAIKKMDSIEPRIKWNLRSEVPEYLKEFEKAGIPASAHNLYLTQRITIGDIAALRQDILSKATSAFGLDFSDDKRWRLFVADDARYLSGSITRRAFESDGPYPYVTIEFRFGGENNQRLEDFRLEVKRFDEPEKYLIISADIVEDVYGHRARYQPDWLPGTNRYILRTAFVETGTHGYVDADKTRELIEKEFGVKI